MNTLLVENIFMATGKGLVQTHVLTHTHAAHGDNEISGYTVHSNTCHTCTQRGGATPINLEQTREQAALPWAHGTLINSTSAGD